MRADENRHVGRGRHGPGGRPFAQQRPILGHQPYRQTGIPRIDWSNRLGKIINIGTRRHLLDQALEQSRFRETLTGSRCGKALLRLVADPSRQVRITDHRATFETRK
ncbi:MAG TPA: hypothetical protein VFX20_14495 [Steroidobacteraceae bacterium]|nr:hypothetical protein [Steroidobacteraceae bacterium]